MLVSGSAIHASGGSLRHPLLFDLLGNSRNVILPVLFRQHLLDVQHVRPLLWAAHSVTRGHDLDGHGYIHKLLIGSLQVEALDCVQVRPPTDLLLTRALLQRLGLS